MTFRRLLVLAQALLMALPLAGQARAATYPWVSLREDDIQAITSAGVEAEIRLELVRAAKQSIDVVIYDQRADLRIGLPLLRELRAAADRGVKVRFATAWIAEVAADVERVVPRYLTQPPTREPIQVMIVGGIQMRLKGWSLTDGIHEKLLVVDGDKLLTTGRGQTDYYLNWLDSAYLIRGELARQSQQAFEEIWATCRRENPLFNEKGDLARSPEFKDFKTLPLELGASEQAQLAQLSDWLKAPSATGGERPPLRGRLLHHDFLKQMRALPKDPKDYDDAQRLRILQDPVIQALAVRLRGARDIRFNTLSVLLHPDFKAPLFEAVRQGAKARIFTNSREAFHIITPVAAPWIVALPDLEETLAQGIQVDAFRAVAGKPHIYLHRKLAVIDDTVFIGSHNFNLPSTVANDEVSFEIEGAPFAQRMRELFDTAVRDYGTPIQREEIARQRRHTVWGREIFRPFLGIF